MSRRKRQIRRQPTHAGALSRSVSFRARRVDGSWFGRPVGGADLAACDDRQHTAVEADRSSGCGAHNGGAQRDARTKPEAGASKRGGHAARHGAILRRGRLGRRARNRTRLRATRRVRAARRFLALKGLVFRQVANVGSFERLVTDGARHDDCPSVPGAVGLRALMNFLSPSRHLPRPTQPSPRGLGMRSPARSALTPPGRNPHRANPQSLRAVAAESCSPYPGSNTPRESTSRPSRSCRN